MANSQTRLCLASPKLADGLSAPGVSSGPLPPILATGTADYAALLAGAAPAGDLRPTRKPRRGCSTPAAPPAGPRARCSPTATCSSPATATTPTSTPSAREDTILHAAPLTHGSGLYGLAHLARGSHNVILPGSFDPERVLDALAAHANVSMFAAPTMVSRLINHGKAGSTDTRGLKTIVYGGAPMYVADLKRALELFGPKLYQLYGQGESPMTITGLDKAAHADTAHPRYEERLGSAGVARTGVAVKVVDEAGRELPPGEVGEIVTTQRLRDEGLLEQPRGQRPGPARRLAVDRRPRRARRRRLPHPQGPLQGHDHLRRRPTSIRARSRRCC